MVKDVDRSDLISPNLVVSPVLGSIPVTRLSGGVKTLIQVAHDSEHIYNDCIFFIDEGNSFLRRKEFADVVKGADNYFVIVSREKFPQLPYSIDEIYGLREGSGSGRYHDSKRVYSEMYRIFGSIPKSEGAPGLVVTEAEKS